MINWLTLVEYTLNPTASQINISLYLELQFEDYKIVWKTFTYAS